MTISRLLLPDGRYIMQQQQQQQQQRNSSSSSSSSATAGGWKSVSLCETSSIGDKPSTLGIQIWSQGQQALCVP